MRRLLLSFLLAIFFLQATFVAVGGNGFAPAGVEHSQSMSGFGFGQGSYLDDHDGSQKSWAIEEMSDYIPADLSLPHSVLTVAAPRPPAPGLLSIDLPRIKPPPRC